MRFAGVLALLLLACGPDPRHFMRVDAGVQVTGCDDPAVWTAPALRHARLDFEAYGPDYPLGTADVDWTFDGGGLSEQEHARLDRGTACWRVLDADPGSGWSAGQQFETDPDPYGFRSVNVMGFERSVTLEGRILFDDGIVAFATDAQAAALGPAKILESDASDVVVVMSSVAWAESNAVILDGVRAPTDPVLDGIGQSNGPLGQPRTLNRTAQGLVLREWSKDARGAIVQVDTPLGQGTKAWFAGFDAIVIDDELIVLDDNHGTTTVKQRFQLGAEPLEAAVYSDGVLLHMSGALVSYDYATGLNAQRPVGEGVLIQRHYGWLGGAPMFFEGRTFHALRRSGDFIVFDSSGSFSATPEEVAALGTPRAVLHDTVFGENGLLSAVDPEQSSPGPRFASFAELVGDGHLGPVPRDTSAYVIKHADGSAVMYESTYAPSGL